MITQYPANRARLSQCGYTTTDKSADVVHSPLHAISTPPNPTTRCAEVLHILDFMQRLTSSQLLDRSYIEVTVMGAGTSVLLSPIT